METVSFVRCLGDFFSTMQFNSRINSNSHFAIHFTQLQLHLAHIQTANPLSPTKKTKKSKKKRSLSTCFFFFPPIKSQTHRRPPLATDRRCAAQCLRFCCSASPSPPSARRTRSDWRRSTRSRAAASLLAVSKTREQKPIFYRLFFSSSKKKRFSLSHTNVCCVARETPALCFHTPQNPFANEGGLQWMCKNENLCMACAPTRASTVNDGFDHFRAQYKCQLDECKTYLPYLLCPAAACRIV